MEHLMVTAEWLFQRLDHKNIKIVEATFFLPTMNRDAMAEYQSLHIPDAVFFDIDTIADPHSELPHMLPSAEAFENSMQGTPVLCLPVSLLGLCRRVTSACSGSTLVFRLCSTLRIDLIFPCDDRQNVVDVHVLVQKNVSKPQHYCSSMIGGCKK